MQVLRLIRERFPRDGWVDCITKGELAAARKLFRELRAKNEEIDLGDCLPLRCKARILLSDPGLRRSAGFGSKEAGQDFFDELGRLRNRLAHAQDIITGRWPRLAVFAKEAGEVLERLESTSGGL